MNDDDDDDDDDDDNNNNNNHHHHHHHHHILSVANWPKMNTNRDTTTHLSTAQGISM